jgi:hypothetical protein
MSNCIIGPYPVVSQDTEFWLVYSVYASLVYVQPVLHTWSVRASSQWPSLRSSKQTLTFIPTASPRLVLLPRLCCHSAPILLYGRWHMVETPAHCSLSSLSLSLPPSLPPSPPTPPHPLSLLPPPSPPLPPHAGIPAHMVYVYIHVYISIDIYCVCVYTY